MVYIPIKHSEEVISGVQLFRFDLETHWHVEVKDTQNLRGYISKTRCVTPYSISPSNIRESHIKPTEYHIAYWYCWSAGLSQHICMPVTIVYATLDSSVYYIRLSRNVNIQAM